MGGDDQEQGGRRGEIPGTRGQSVSHGRSVTTSAGTESVAFGHSESRAETGDPADDWTMSGAWTRMVAADGSQIRGSVLTELARLLAEPPGAVSLDAVATRGSDLFLTLRVPRARLAKVFGGRGTAEDMGEKQAEADADGTSRGVGGTGP